MRPQLYRVGESLVSSENELSCILCAEDTIWCVTYKMERKMHPGLNHWKILLVSIVLNGVF